MKKIVAILCAVVLAASVLLGVTNVRSSNRIKGLNEEIEALRSASDADAAEKAAQIETLTAEAAEKAAQIETLTAEAAEKAAQIETLTAEAAEKTAQIETLTAEAAEKSAQIETLTAEAAEKSAQIETLTVEAAEKAAQIETLTAEAEERNAQVERLQEELEAAQTKLQTISETLSRTAPADWALPAVGDAVNGFVVKDVRGFALLGADVVLFEHEKTGALVMLLANEDNNRTFEITFRTPAETDMGVSHVFEHSTLDGSEKYPSKSLFFNLSYQTYNTYMNAATYNMMTTYPVASLSEAQLLKYADFYTDSCFHPMLYSDRSIIDEEAWRYSLTDADAELTLAGTVYSEMLGAYTLNAAASFDFMKTLFPGSTVGNSHGGNPARIPDMTYEDLIAYHEKYYHPSNSLTCLYGNFEDYAAFLSLLDGYFAAYEKREITIADSLYTPLSEKAEARFEFAVEAGSSTENGAMVYYGFVCGEKDKDTMNRLDMLTTLLGSDASALMQNMKTALPSASVGCYLDITGPELAVVFYASGVNPQDADLFEKTVRASLEEIAQNGFNPDDVDAIIAAFRLELLLTGESTGIGTSMIPNIAYYWASTGNLYGFMDYVDSLDLFQQYAQEGVFAQAVEDYLLGNERTALTCTFPQAGLKEQQDALLAEKLAGVKAAMSEEEISAIVAQTAALANPQEEEASQYVAQLQAVSVSTLPEEARIYEISDAVGEGGSRVVNARADAEGVGQTLLLLDAGGLEQEQVHYFKLFTQLLGELDTAAHTRGELASLITRYLYGANIRVSVLENGEEGYTPYLRVSFIALDEDMEAAYALVRELLFDGKLEDVQRLRDQVAAIKTELKRTVTNTPYYIPLYRAFATQSSALAYYNYVTYLDYYAFLEQVEARLETNPQEVADALRAVRDYFNNSTGAVIGFSGSEESAAGHQAAAEAFLAGLDKREIAPRSYAFEQAAHREATVVDSAVNYNMVFAGYDELPLDEYSGALDAVAALVTDSFLYPLLRDQYGAYAVMHGASDEGVYILSYRDPNVQQTFDVYAALADMVEKLEALDQETLDGYILSSYSQYAQSAGEITGGMAAVLAVLSGERQEKVLDYMRQLKSVTADSVAGYAELYRALAQKGMIATVGPASAISANASLYDRVVDPFGVGEQPEQTLDDVQEGDWYYEAVHFVYENGLMAPAAIDRFGALDDATVGDLAVCMYVLVNGNNDPEEAVAALAQAGVLPADADAAAPLPGEMLVRYADTYSMVLGLGETEVQLHDPQRENASRADVAQALLDIYMTAISAQ